MDNEQLIKLIKYLKSQKELSVEVVNELEIVFEMKGHIIEFIQSLINEIEQLYDKKLTPEDLCRAIELDYIDNQTELGFYEEALNSFSLDDEIYSEIKFEMDLIGNKLKKYNDLYQVNTINRNEFSK